MRARTHAHARAHTNTHGNILISGSTATIDISLLYMYLQQARSPLSCLHEVRSEEVNLLLQVALLPLGQGTELLH